MGDFVDKNSLNIIVPDISPQDAAVGNFEGDINPSAPWEIVSSQFEQSLADAAKWASTLEGYLAILDGIISPSPATDVTSGNIPDTSSVTASIAVASSNIFAGVASPGTVASGTASYTNAGIVIPDTLITDAPVMSGDIDTDFPDFSPTPYTLDTIPGVDISSFDLGDIPPDVVAAISWFEASYDDTLFQAIYSNLIADLASGTGGLGGTVEQEMYDRTVARQDVDNDAKYREIEDYAASRDFDLPTGALMGRLQEQANVSGANNLAINGEILIKQADLAQKNQQFVITSLTTLEGFLREHNNNINNRSLDYSKAVAANAVAVYSALMSGYIAAAEASKIYVQVQIENLRAVIESNDGKIKLYIAESEAYKAEIDATSKKNEAITDVYKSEIAGYDSERKAISENERNIVSAYEVKVRDSDAAAKTEIAQGQMLTDANTAEAKNFTDASTSTAKNTTDVNIAVGKMITDASVASAKNETDAAIAANAGSIDLVIADARNELDAAIASTENLIKGYGSEYSLRERVAEAQANIAMQAVSAAYSTVNASAGLSYSGSESQSESFSHSESKSDNYSRSQSISKSGTISQSISNALGESHSYEE